MMNDATDAADQAFAGFVAAAREDPSVGGLVLHGSRVFEGMATAHSDYDLCLVTDGSEQGKGADLALMRGG